MPVFHKTIYELPSYALPIYYEWQGRREKVHERYANVYRLDAKLSSRAFQR